MKLPIIRCLAPNISFYTKSSKDVSKIHWDSMFFIGENCVHFNTNFAYL